MKNMRVCWEEGHGPLEHLGSVRDQLRVLFTQRSMQLRKRGGKEWLLIATFYWGSRQGVVNI